MDNIQKALDEFKELLENDSELKRIAETITNKSATYQQATEYAWRTGELQCEVLKKYTLDEEMQNMLLQLAEENFTNVSVMCDSVRQIMFDNLEIGLKPTTPKFKKGNVFQATEILKKNETIEEALPELSKEIVYESVKVVDEHSKATCSFMDGVGLSPKVTRIYDNVGIHTQSPKYKKQCDFCISRCGVNVPYSEAIKKDMFRRHPGCGCTILYEVNKRIQTI